MKRNPILNSDPVYCSLTREEIIERFAKAFTMAPKNIAVVLAGGVGSRLGLSTPKQFLKVAGKMVIEHTIDAFERNANIDEIAVVSNPAYVADVETMVLNGGWTKVKKILNGGKERYDSSLSAIRAYEGRDVNLIFHDAVRPLVSQRIIDDVCEALKTSKAIDVTLPAVDTIIEAEGDHICQIPDRSRLQRGQTPQAFRYEVIAEAYRRALQDPDFKVTDDCGVVVKYTPEVPVTLVRGEESNMKLTYKEDTYLIDKFFQLRRSELSTRCEQKDIKALSGKVAVIFGGSYGIGKDTADMLTEAGAHVHSFARGTTNTDVSRREDVAAALKSVAETEGHIDFVINTAGILNREPLATMDYDVIRTAVDTNYMGTVNVAIEAYPYLSKTKGKLLFFTSSSYTRGRAFYSIYSSTKAAIVNFVQAIAQEWENTGITINCINPERTKTPMRVRNFGAEPEDSLLKSIEVAEATIHSLLTDYTGQVIDVKRKDTGKNPVS